MLFVGLDGADFDVVSNLLKSGRLPNLEWLAGTFLRLTPTVPPHTAPSWTSMFTGLNPGKHGVFYFYHLKTGRLINSSQIPVPYLWELAGRAGIKSVVANVPLTYPVRKLNGIMISGMHAHQASRFSVYPESLVGSIGQEWPFEGGEIGDIFRAPADPSGNYERYLSDDERRAGLFGTLLRENSWDFGCIVLTALDRVAHPFWDTGAATQAGCNRLIEDAYVRIDAAVGGLLDIAEEQGAVVFVASDHGFEGKDVAVHVNRLLTTLGFKARQKLSFTVVEIVRNLVHDLMPRLPGPARASAERFAGLFYNFLLLNLKKSAPVGNGEPRLLAGPYGLITSNGEEEELLSGRPGADGQFDAIAHRIQTRLSEAVGSPVVVKTSSEVYWGNRVGSGPALLVLPKKGVQFDGVESGQLLNYSAGGNHSDRGVLLSNVRLDSGADEEGAQVYDVAPTVLSLLGLEVPRSLDGKSLVKATGGAALQTGGAAPLGEVFTMPLEEEEEIRGHLKDIGYE